MSVEGSELFRREEKGLPEEVPVRDMGRVRAGAVSTQATGKTLQRLVEGRCSVHWGRPCGVPGSVFLLDYSLLVSSPSCAHGSAHCKSGHVITCLEPPGMKS